VWPALVDENLTQRCAQAPGLDIGQPGEIATGKLDLDQVWGSSSQVQRRRLSFAVSAEDSQVVPAQPSQQRRGGQRAHWSPHPLALFLIMPSPCVPAVAIAYCNVGVGCWSGERRCELV
jgi:hypothetical protein